jgi:hypothetical protein
LYLCRVCGSKTLCPLLAALGAHSHVSDYVGAHGGWKRVLFVKVLVV